MPFVASNGLTEAGASKTIAAGGMNVHYHDLGAGEPALFLHSYGPGTTAWTNPSAITLYIGNSMAVVCQL
jgi:2-hydroxy-6-oxonona-2,4-dienedioate hydrolase